ncbi:MAG: Maf family protein [Planctomycetota bacterium]
MSPRLVLASTSPYRRRLLARLGFAFDVAAPGVDEEAVAPPGSPLEVAEALARAKALAVASSVPADAVVIGSDQVCALGDLRLGKPGTAAGAVAQLERLAGKTHELITAVAVVTRGVVTGFVDRTRLTMRPLTLAEIEAYVAEDDPVDCAGSYKLEAAGISLFERIDSVDWTAIEGLPLLELARVLRDCGLTRALG